jgi:hypothetical protein
MYSKDYLDIIVSATTAGQGRIYHQGKRVTFLNQTGDRREMW